MCDKLSSRTGSGMVFSVFVFFFLTEKNDYFERVILSELNIYF